jgi:hypothetical protein
MRKILVRTGFFLTLGILLMASGIPEEVPLDPEFYQEETPDSFNLPSRCRMENTTFQDGEEVVYTIYYNWNFVWLAAGEAHFKVRDLGDQYHISVVGQTYKSYEWFFKVDDKYDTYIDKETLLPTVSIRDVHEGKYTLYDKVTFDWDRGMAISLRGDTKAEAKVTEYPIENCMHDILSIIYYTRNLDFDDMPEDTRIPIKIFMDKETWPLKVHYRGKEKKKRIRGLGKYRAIVFGPEVIKGYVFSEEEGMNVWVSDDKNRVPLLIESPVSVGSVKVILKEYKGLRHDFDAKL